MKSKINKKISDECKKIKEDTKKDLETLIKTKNVYTIEELQKMKYKHIYNMEVYSRGSNKSYLLTMLYAFIGVLLTILTNGLSPLIKDESLRIWGTLGIFALFSFCAFKDYDDGFFKRTKANLMASYHKTMIAVIDDIIIEKEKEQQKQVRKITNIIKNIF